MSRKRTAFTLVELLVVIAIIGILVTLLPARRASSPGRQLAEPSARTMSNSSRSVACSTKAPKSTCRRAAGAIGTRPDPNRGYGSKQPGSWVYSILPYIEEQSIHDLGKGETCNGATASAAFQAASQKLFQSTITAVQCPTRRSAKLYPYVGGGPVGLLRSRSKPLRATTRRIRAIAKSLPAMDFRHQATPNGSRTYTAIDADWFCRSGMRSPSFARRFGHSGKYCQTGVVGLAKRV